MRLSHSAHLFIYLLKRPVATAPNQTNKMDIERRSAVPPPKKDSQTDKPNQPSGSGSATQPPNDQADSILVYSLK